MTSAPRCEIRSYRQLRKAKGPKSREKLLQFIDGLGDRAFRDLEFETVSGGPPDKDGLPTPWWTVARDDQLPPLSLEAEKLIWLVLAGRGWGKTRVGAEWSRRKALLMPGSRGAFVAKDPGEARDTMIEGVSGVLACSPSHFRPAYNPSLKRLTWPNGTIVTVFSSEDYEELRGPQHHWVWGDEPFKWRNVEKTWEQVQFGLRLGARPQACLTSTPRPLKILKEMMRDPLTHITRGTTRDNLGNLSPFYMSIVRKLQGTRLGRQELEAQILDDVPGALWVYKFFDDYRVTKIPDGVDLARVVVAIDPSASEDGNEAGIVAVGRGTDGRGYTLADRTQQGRPEAWAKAAVDLLRLLNGDRIIAEANNGGAMVEATIKAYDRTVPVHLVHASRGKITRAEPVAVLYERGLVSHVGTYPELEDECCTYQELDLKAKKASPNRMDALVWGFTDLFGKDIVTREQMAEAIAAAEEVRDSRVREEESSGFFVQKLRTTEIFQ